MKKNNFIINKNILLIHIKMHYKLILVFIIAWFLLTTIIINNFANHSPLYIAPTKLVSTDKTHLWISNEGLSAATNYITNIFGFGAFALFLLTFVKIVIVDELKDKGIIFWMNTSKSRNQIMFSKIIFLWTILMFIFIPPLIVQLIYASLTKDASKYIGLVFVKNISFILFELMFSSIIILIAILFSEKYIIAKSLFVVIIMYTSITMVMAYYGEGKIGPAWIKYITLSELMNFDCLKFADATAPDANHKIRIADFIGETTILTIFFPIINIFLITGLTTTSLWIFNNRDINI